MEPQYDGTDSMQRVNEIPANVFSDDIGWFEITFKWFSTFDTFQNDSFIRPTMS